jgi:hypothetical protein
MRIRQVVRPLLLSAEDVAKREAIEREVGELERLCGELEASLTATDWTAAANALRDTRRARHAFLNALDTAVSARDLAFDEGVRARVRVVFDRRQVQLERLRAMHDEIGERLQTLSKWKSFARKIGARQAPTPSAGFDSTH